MTSPTPPARVTTGIPELDTVLDGGLMRAGSYVIAGAPGAGKTILGNQLCFHHVASGKQAVYVTLLSESHGRMLTHLRRMSFFDPKVISESLHYVSGYPVLRKDNLKGLLTMVAKLIRRHQATLLVIDGLARVGAFANSSTDFKQFIHELNVLLEFTGCTAVLLTDSTAEDIGYPARTMVDGLFELRDRLEGVRSVRELVVTKFRGGPFLRGVHFFEIDDDGIRLYPRLEARLARPSREPVASKRRISSGVAGLDRMTGGGLAEGTSTLVLGASGTGKTMLGLHFLAAGFAKKEPSLYFGFFESPARLLSKGDELGLKLSAHDGSGAFEVIWQPAGELIMDALAERLLDRVQKHKVQRLVIDGLAGFEDSLARPDRLTHFFKALTNELRGLGVTTLVTGETREYIEPQVKLPLRGLPGVVAENIILLRQLEIDSELRRALAVIKTRESAHDQTVRALTIGDRGLEIGEPFGARAPHAAVARGKRRKGRAP